MCVFDSYGHKSRGGLFVRGIVQIGVVGGNHLMHAQAYRITISHFGTFAPRIMKILTILSAFTLLTASLHQQRADAWELRRVTTQSKHRKLSNRAEWNFLVSQISEDQAWCMSVAGPQNDIQLQDCDFVNAPPEQLWKFQDNRLWNDLGNGDSKCVTLKHSLSDGVGMRLVDCSDDDEPNSLMDFYWADDDGYIQPLSADDGAPGAYCLTNRGANAHVSDPILAKPCLCTRSDYRWMLTEEDPRNEDNDDYGDYWLFELYGDGGCVQPKGGETTSGTLVILDECNSERAWNVKEKDGVVTFRSRLDTDMCLQAGLGGAVEVGTKMRLAKCNAGEYLQQFSWNDFEAPILLSSRDDLCMMWRGVNGNPGVDPIIMTDCAKRPWTEWSGDELYES